jgi:hypothetical protein
LPETGGVLMEKEYRILFFKEEKLVYEQYFRETSKYQAKKRAKALAERNDYETFIVQEEVS